MAGLSVRPVVQYAGIVGLEAWGASDLVKPYLLFDAGGTLVFPDQTFLLQEAQRHGIRLTDKQLFAGYYRLIYHLDFRAYTRDRQFPLNPWPRGYASAVFETLSVNGAGARTVNRSAVERHRDVNLWTFTFSWVRETLSLLAKLGYQMSVLSNSDGRTKDVFRDLELEQFFDRIFDSAEMRLTKPGQKIFQCALQELGLQPEDALYVGDIYAVDIRGASQVGLGAIHIDPFDLYKGWPGVHLRGVHELPCWLAGYAANPQVFDLFPVAPLKQAAEATARERQSLRWIGRQVEGGHPAPAPIGSLASATLSPGHSATRRAQELAGRIGLSSEATAFAAGPSTGEHLPASPSSDAMPRHEPYP